MSSKTFPLRFKWASCSADWEQYKPNGNTFWPEDTYIVIEIPADYVMSQKKVGKGKDAKIETTLTEEGQAWITAKLSMLSKRATAAYRQMSTKPQPKE